MATMSSIYNWLVEMRGQIRRWLSDPETVKSYAVYDRAGRFVGVNLCDCAQGVKDSHASLIWDRSAFVGPGFEQYVYYDWKAPVKQDTAQLGIIPVADFGLTEESWQSADRDPATWNNALLSGIPEKFKGDDYESGHILLHELAHLYHARRMDPRSFARVANEATFETARWRYVPEQFADLVSGCIVAVQEAHGRIEEKYPNVSVWIEYVETIHNINTSKEGKLRRWQRRRAQELYQALTGR